MLKFPSNADQFDQLMIEVFENSNSSPTETIVMFRPTAIAFGDSAAFNNFNKGFSDLITGQGEGDFNGTQLSQDTMTARTQQMVADASGSQVFQTATESVLINQGKAFNPNTVLQFQNSAIRQFSFQWKIMPMNEQESIEFAKIEKTLRKFMYAKRSNDNYMLDYPARFRITIVQAENTLELNLGLFTPTASIRRQSGASRFYPLISECFLSNLQTTYNPNSNMSYYSGAPAEVDFSITFQETHALHRDFHDEDFQRLSGL